MKRQYMVYFIIAGLLLGSFLGSLRANASNTNPTGGETATQIVAGSSIVWDTPNNAKDNNSIYCTAIGNIVLGQPTLTQYLYIYNFGFSSVLDTTSIVDGISVCIYRKSSANSVVRDDALYLIDSTQTMKGINKASGTYYTTTRTKASYGSQSDLWSAGLTTADIRSTNFGIYLRCYIPINIAEYEANIDYVYIVITYHSAPTVPTSFTATATTGKIGRAHV